MKWMPKPYQTRGVDFLNQGTGRGLWFDPGLGKTSTVLRAIKDQDLRALVVGPLRVVQIVWPAEIQRWDEFRDMTFNLLHGPKKHKVLDQKVQIDLVNPEGLHWLFEHTTWPWNCLVLDESTKFKSWTSQRTKLLRHFINNFEYRWTLTGSPMPNSIEDLFPQVYFMDRGEALGKHITEFRARYMRPGGYLGYEHIALPGAVKEISEKIKPIVMRLKVEDWLTMPPLTEDIIDVHLGAAEYAQYKKLERDFVVSLKGISINATTAATLGMKLRQFTNGIVYGEGGKAYGIAHEEKLNALKDLVEDLAGNPLLVAVAFKSEVEVIRQMFSKVAAFKNKTIPYIGSGMNKKELDITVRDWNAGKLPLVLVHPASGSLGLNLQETAHHVCWFGLTWNLMEHDQLIDRVWRQGQKKPVIVHYIMCAKTKDQDIVKVLTAKSHTQSELLDAIKAPT